MEFQLNEHHVGRPAGRVGMLRACKNILYMAASLVKEDAATRGLQEDVSLAVSRVRTGWRRTASVAMSWIVYCTHYQIYPQDHGAKTEGPLHALTTMIIKGTHIFDKSRSNRKIPGSRKVTFSKSEDPQILGAVV
jgi:hypothetical protein